MKQKALEDELLALEIANVKIIIVGSGMQYGYKEQSLEMLVQAAWRQSPSQLTYLGTGMNMVPAIHIKDLAKLVILKVCESNIGEQKYVLAVDDSLPEKKTQKAIVQALSKWIGTGKVESVK